MTDPNAAVVRAAGSTDAEAICRIYNAALAERSSTFETEPRSASDFAERIEDSRFPFLVADTGREVLGWAALAAYSGRPCYAGIGECSVYVTAEARSRGIGAALTEALADAAQGGGFHKMIGKLFTDNTASIRLVERCGFSSIGLHRRHGQLDGEWRDVLVVERLLDEPIRLAPYDPSWPAKFSEERSALEEAIGPWVLGGIHHVGSTAVPGLAAKPIVDILVGVENLEASRACFDPLAKLGYLYAPYERTEMHWFCKPHPNRRTHHLHLVPSGSRRFRDELAFRDRLRESAETAEEYATLKHELAERFAEDREAYTDAKADLIRRVLDGR
jgi:GrpB-like predicted nucleotidyltransferase (UPF0157 family)/ribosomal protein S18 acetylase RimI-like enzyme